MSRLAVPDRAEREELASFVGRVVRLDPAAVVRLRRLAGELRVWAQTPFDVLGERSARGSLQPEDVTVHGSHLLAALAVARADEVDPGVPADLQWRSALPPDDGWRWVADLPSTQLDRIATEGLRTGTDPATSVVLGVAGERSDRVTVPMRCMFALCGLDLIRVAEPVRLSATPSWLRLETKLGAVFARRVAQLPLVGVG